MLLCSSGRLEEKFGLLLSALEKMPPPELPRVLMTRLGRSVTVCALKIMLMPCTRL